MSRNTVGFRVEPPSPQTKDSLKGCKHDLGLKSFAWTLKFSMTYISPSLILDFTKDTDQ
jgi:hypothetical protein